MLNVSGELIIKNADIVASEDSGIIASGKNTNVTLAGVTMRNPGRCLDVLNGATVTIDKDSVLEATSTNCTVFVGAEKGEKAKLIVNGTVKCDVENYAIAGNGTDTIGSDIIINDGAQISSASDSAIYQPQAGTIIINGGTIEGKDGIYQKCGTITVNGGTIKGTGNAEYKYNGNGSNAMGHGIVVEFTNYPSGMPKLNVVGGEIISEQKEAVGYALSPKYAGDKTLDELKAEYVSISDSATLTGKTE